MGTLNLLVLLSCILATFPLTIAQFCSNNNFTANSTYGINRNLILSSLPYNVTTNSTYGGFYTATVPQQDSETIYALALCRGDLTNQSCFECVNSSIQAIMTKCSNQKDAYDFGSTSHCIVRFSNKSFFASVDWQQAQVVYGGSIKGDTDELYIYVALVDLVDKLISRAAEGNSSLKFATDKKNYTEYKNVYGLMQCVPGLSSDDCTSCLRAAKAVYTDGFLRTRFVNVMTPSCIFQYDLSPFVESSVGDAPPPPPPPPPDDNTTRTVIIIVVSTIGSVIGFIVCVCIFLRKRKQKKNPKQKVEVFEAEDQIGILGSLQYDFETISIATNNFSDGNKLGQGGFGAVYQGRLLNGQEIAVKRLAKESQQGEIEFKNEVMLVAKLQHRNLVRLLGFCLEGTERLLIYEFVPQSSLDHLIFNSNGRKLLGWDRRYKIIGGVSRGLLYLHEDSRLRIIHRDLKASNVLLDEDMNPKISDFGMARLFVVDETQGSTNRIVGTYGYMAPEYAMHGQFSVKSDVFSFGVLVLEILSGQKNNSTRNGENVEDLLSYAWKTWREGTASNLIDPTLRANSGSMREMIRCIHIGLLCVQENVADRPTMASVVLMLSSSTLSLPVPSEPAFFLRSGSTNSELPLLQEHSSELAVSGHSINEVSITELYPR
ncbi:cysteine-rich receptor-like protein kinase 44 isoform X2 [Rhododendron vialii]|uniref:cysteine-rich receptor-like protein kinase 44 isoform X2 n=1 Tax=Rhododendron vialii TaxID=182163 RepID=UPI00265D918D|nr:cysteine-rich receptor-like protein kinase 44 isoform X2 [Rhododendron vialii]